MSCRPPSLTASSPPVAKPMPALHRRMLVKLASSLLVVLAPFVSGTVLADECDRLPPPSVTIKRLEERITVDTSRDRKTLTHLGSALARPGNVVLGLTRGNAVVRFETRTASYVSRTGRWECASPQIVLSYGFSPMTVYVAREFAKESCAYREIYQHELEHVRIYKEHLASIEKEITEAMNRRFSTGKPWRGAPGEGHAKLQKELDERWLPYVQRLISRVEEAQAQIDTPEEYAKVSATCGDEISKYVR